MNPITRRLMIPQHWSPEQATAVYELLSQLADQVWAHYQDHIIEHLGLLNERYDYPEQSDPRQIDLFDDTIPF